MYKAMVGLFLSNEVLARKQQAIANLVTPFFLISRISFGLQSEISSLLQSETKMREILRAGNRKFLGLTKISTFVSLVKIFLKANESIL